MLVSDRSLASLVIGAQHAQIHLRTADGLHQAAQAVCKEAQAQGCLYLAAASSDAHAVVGAAVIVSGGDLRLLEEQERSTLGDEPVLVVDCVVITRRTLNAKFAQLKNYGFAQIREFVYHDFGVSKTS
jgi:hypothetical protein